MYDADSLKQTIRRSETMIKCTVLGCDVSIPRQRGRFRRTPEYRCPKHRIYISLSTFEYECVDENLLWADAEDIARLEAINTVKRESRMARDNSEDAVTWIVFRCLERNKLLPQFVARITASPSSHANLVYWWYCSQSDSVCPQLAEERKTFGENPQGGSEPDVIVDCGKLLLFIEAKLTASNRTSPRSAKGIAKYVSRAGGWCQQPF